MARPIKPTPILVNKDAREFENRVERGREQPLKVTTAPSLDKAKKAVFASVFTCPA